jgi:hypothetical protein
MSDSTSMILDSEQIVDLASLEESVGRAESSDWV